MGNPTWRHLETTALVNKARSRDKLDTIHETSEDDLHETLMFYETEIPKRLQYVDQAFMSYRRKNTYICPETLFELKRRISIQHGYTFQVFALSVVNGRYGIVFEI